MAKPLDYPIEKLPEGIYEWTGSIVDDQGNTVEYGASASRMKWTEGDQIRGDMTIAKGVLVTKRCFFSPWRTKKVWKRTWIVTGRGALCKYSWEKEMFSSATRDMITEAKNAGIGFTPELLDLTVLKVEKKIVEMVREQSCLRIAG